MSKTIPAVYRNGQICPLEPLTLPENTLLEVVVPTESEGDVPSEPIVDPLAAICEIAQDLGPTDFASRLDHYLYGIPRSE
jgi:predicted DNA-binding antitoxin AbrB/MazE fold protein